MIGLILILVALGLLILWRYDEKLKLDRIIPIEVLDVIGASSFITLMVLIIILLLEANCASDGNRIVSRENTDIDVVYCNRNNIEYTIGDIYKFENRAQIVRDSENGSYRETITTKSWLFGVTNDEYIFHLEKEK